MNLRPASVADAAFLAESLIAIARTLRDRGGPYASYWPDAVTPREFEYALACARGGDKLALVAEEGNDRIGCLLAEIGAGSVPALGTGPVGLITACWVGEEFRKRGIAKGLAERAEAWFRGRGLRFAELSHGTAAAGAAWERLGYAPFRTLACKDLDPGSSPGPM